MDGPEETSSQFNGLFGPTVIVAIGGLIAYFTIEPALDSQRPNLSNRKLPPPPMTSGVPAVQTRLWDDPLQAAFAASQDQHNAGSRKSPVDTLEDIQRYFATIVQSDSRSSNKAGNFLC